MNQNEINYDAIILSASFAGVVAAIKLKTSGEKVLLLNRYGFFGGSITESLNLFQKIPVEIENEKGILSDILQGLFNEKDAVLYNQNQQVVLNPEVVKYVLQQKTVQHKIDLLFHIIPGELNFSNDQIELVVYGKEGEIKLKTKQIYDFSAEFTLSPLIDPDARKFLQSRINLITLKLDDDVLNLDDVLLNIKLNDNRRWISCKLNAVSIYEVESLAQEKFDQLDKLFREKKSRIQIVPPQSYYQFEFLRSTKFDERIKFISDFYNRFQADEELLIAQKVEGLINYV